MPGGKKDSSRTRVVPVFDKLKRRSDDWVRRLLSVPRYPGVVVADVTKLDLSFSGGFWGANEYPFGPPTRLLEWLVRNPTELRHNSSSHPDRNSLLKGDQAALKQALAEIERHPRGRGWHLLEGTSFPDATVVTPDAVIVVEGKRTESGPTTDTSWLAGRHQIWRHIEGAWGMRSARKVFGFFIVEEADGRISELWERAAKETVSERTLSTSFPHLSAEEKSEIAGSFIGVATWQQVCAEFDIDVTILPDTVDDLSGEP